ncbi:MAG: lamin tail domain-containing protein [Candidatus Cloacimonetes bacterium]|nr:lamin tail domain-containing protein [Candidatus Cloacimonadota bacterium]
MKLPKIIALFISLFSFLFAGNVFAATEPTNIYLSEFAANPEEGSEWVEIYNPTATPVDLTDWQIDDIEGGSSPFSIPAGTIIAPSEYLVFEIGTKLNNSGDSVRLLDNSGAVVDEFSYSGAKKGYSWARNANFDWQETMEQTPEEINVIVTPIPTPSPTPTSTPTLTPTPTVAPTPTPQTTLTIAFSPPKEAQIDQEFSLSVSLGNAGPNSSYYLKALIGETSDTSGMREGKTLSEDEQTFLAWNASWNKMPILQTNNNGVGERTIEIKTGENIVAGNIF